MTRIAEHRITNRLRELRQAAGMTQDDLEQLTGIPRRTIYRIEQGKANGMDYHTITVLCDALKCQLGDLLQLGPVVQVKLPGLAAEPAPVLATASKGKAKKKAAT